MNAEELCSAWRTLPTPDSAAVLEAVQIAEREVWAAVDHEGRWHLLVGVPASAEAPPTNTRGLRVTVARHQVQGADPAVYMDLTCLSESANPTFAAVAADIGSQAGALSEDERVDAVKDALSRWRWFWGIEEGILSDQEALGLFAELWFLLRWGGDAARAIGAWTGSAGSRHDFQWPEYSVEVKAAARRAGGAVLHRIGHLDQLMDPETGDLYLFSLRVVRDQLAHNTLPSLIDRITEALHGNPVEMDEFLRKLGRRGYSPALKQRYAVPYRVLGEYLYTVAMDFPRLTVASIGGLPSGVTDVSYVLDMAACDPWLTAKTPEEWIRH